MTNVAYPFLRLDDGAIAASDWMVQVGPNDEAHLNGRIDQWDYAVGLRLSRRIDLDVHDAAAQLGLGDESLQLRAVVTVGIGGSGRERLRFTAWHGELGSGSSSQNAEINLDPAAVSQAISLTTEILFVAPSDAGNRLSPKQTGARLWSDIHVADLEPGRSRFPIEAVSFHRLFGGRANHALWSVDRSPSALDHNFSDAVRLLINSDQPEFVARVSSGDEELLDLLVSSLVVQVIRSVIDRDDFGLDLRAEFPDSVGGVVAEWIEQAFPNQSVTSVREMARGDPVHFEAVLASTALVRMT